MKKRPSITLLTVLLTMVFAAGIGVYSSYIGMKIYQESSDHLLESFSQISETFTLFVQRNWTVLRQWDGLLKNADIDHAGSIGADMQANKESWHYSDFYLFNESTQYLTADGRRGSADMDEGQRARMAERIQNTLSAPVVIDGKELSVGVSCGCACYPEDGDASQVRITADSRMYETKQRHHENDRTEGEA